MKNKLPPCFAFKNTGKHPRKDEIKKRFNELDETYNWELCDIDNYYGRNNAGNYIRHKDIDFFGSTVVEITEDDFLAMTEPELTELPKNFAFKYTGKHQFKGEIERRFIEIKGYKYPEFHPEMFYGRKENGDVDWYNSERYFGKDVVEITEQQFLDLTKPELTKLPDNFYFQYVDESQRRLLIERFGQGYQFYDECINNFYGIKDGFAIQGSNNSKIENCTEITQADFIRLTEPEKKVEPEIVTEHLPKPEPTPLTGQIIEISERGILIELTKEQIKEFKIFETVTIK